MKTFRQLREDIGLSTGVGIANPDMPLGGVRRNKFAGYNVFEVDGTTFHRCRLGKLKFKHWKQYVGEDVQGTAIREFANKNYRKSIILQDEKTGAMLFVRAGHLNFLTGVRNNG
jgi:hypothetical protein